MRALPWREMQSFIFADLPRINVFSAKYLGNDKASSSKNSRRKCCRLFTTKPMALPGLCLNTIEFFRCEAEKNSARLLRLKTALCRTKAALPTKCIHLHMYFTDAGLALESYCPNHRDKGLKAELESREDFRCLLCPKCVSFAPCSLPSELFTMCGSCSAEISSFRSVDRARSWSNLDTVSDRFLMTFVEIFPAGKAKFLMTSHSLSHR